MRSGIGLLCAVLTTGFTACTTGPMDLSEVHYYSVTNGTDTSYLRIRTEANTRLGISEFHQGWYPARAVDAVFGDVSKAAKPEEIEHRRTLEAMVRQAIEDTQKEYLKVASDPASGEDALNAAMEARRRVLLFPSSTSTDVSGTAEMEYNPAKDLMLNHWGEKLVLILSSNPDEVVAKIKNFAESEETAYTVNQLGKIVAGSVQSDVGAKASEFAVDANLARALSTSLQTASTAVSSNYGDKSAAMMQIEGLISILQAIR